MYNAKVLTVDDQIEDLEIINHILKKENYNITSAENGREALDILEDGDRFDVIITDRMMPVMDGISFIRRLRQNPEFADIPVVMQTAADDEADVLQGIDSGVHYYITKPFSHKILTTIVKSAIRANKRHRKICEITDFYVKSRKKLKAGMTMFKNSTFEFQTIQEAKNVANALSWFFPESKNMVGPCSELLVNAVEHGNLGITFEEKSSLILDGMWEEEIEYRQNKKENKDKKVVVMLERTDKEVCITITDEGEGFDPAPYLNLDSRRAHKVNGRGIYLAGLEFDRAEYNNKGNQVKCWKRLDIENKAFD